MVLGEPMGGGLGNLLQPGLPAAVQALLLEIMWHLHGSRGTLLLYASIKCRRSDHCGVCAERVFAAMPSL